MIHLHVTEHALEKTAAQGHVLFVHGQDEAKKVAKKYRELALSELMKERQFTGAAGQLIALPFKDDTTMRHLLIVGLGKAEKGSKIPVETYRRALGLVVRSAERHKLDSLALALPSATAFGVSVQELAQQTALTMQIASYQFTEFITDQKRIVTRDIDVTICTDKRSKRDVQKGVKAGDIIAEGVNQARHWIDLPPCSLTPTQLATHAKKIAKEHGLGIITYGEKEINKMGMGGLAGVSRGSDQDCKLVILEYNCGKKSAPTLGFVGKGITFDSGGLSLKPPRYMETMKEDMSGAAAVISAMQVIAQLKPKVNIVALAPLSENLPSGKATKPGDILTFFNGKTAEVKNTDAEGRLVLADALSYAVKEYDLDALIDLATLTGACAYALGPFFTGMMSQHPAWARQVEAAGERSGDRVWALPFNDDYKAAIKSDVADICNIGNDRYMAGAITAGFFLQNFVGDVPWVHLDIAGTAFNVPDMSYFRTGATGVGVRLLTDLAMNYK